MSVSSLLTSPLCFITTRFSGEQGELAEKKKKRELEDVTASCYVAVSFTVTLPKDGGGEVVIPVCDPVRLIQWLESGSEALQRLFNNSMTRHPRSSPWRVIANCGKLFKQRCVINRAREPSETNGTNVWITNPPQG